MANMADKDQHRNCSGENGHSVDPEVAEMKRHHRTHIHQDIMRL